jgi:periplasmic mercuric ion binding protein
MKIIQKIFFTLVLAGFAGAGNAQVVEDTITVEGICGMCKKRIEEAAYGQGVKFVEWTNATSQLAIAYRSDKVTLEEIEKRIAAAGHSTTHVKATEEQYNALPECCRYEHVEKH